MKKNKDSKRYLRNFAWLFILLCLNTAGAFAQFKVSGTITDTNKEALIGVNIVVSGAKTGTISDFNGKYNIEVPNSKAVLVFSYIGYKTVIQEVAGKSIVNIELIEDSKTMDEVVVVASERPVIQTVFNPLISFVSTSGATVVNSDLDTGKTPPSPSNRVIDFSISRSF